jgi:hypothetical protein
VLREWARTRAGRRARRPAGLYEHKLGPEQYADENTAALSRLERDFGAALNRALDGFGARVFAEVETLTRSWDIQRRADLLVRYLGFPYWDILLYPIQSIADAGKP